MSSPLPPFTSARSELPFSLARLPADIVSDDMDDQQHILAQDDRSLAELRDLAIPVLRKYGIRRAGFFGSRARGDHRPDSDLDMLIECPTDRKFSLFDLVGLQDELTQALGIHVQLAEYDSPNERFLAQALPDEISILPIAA